MQAWAVQTPLLTSDLEHTAVEQMRPQSRDLCIPAGDIGPWQGAQHDAADPIHPEVARACDARQPISVETLRSDQVGAQRTIRRITLVPTYCGGWLASSGRHWDLDRPGPR